MEISANTHLGQVVDDIANEFIPLREEFKKLSASIKHWEDKGETNAIGYHSDVKRINEIYDTTDSIKTVYLNVLGFAADEKEFLDKFGIVVSSVRFEESPAGIVLARREKPIEFIPELDYLGSDVKVGDLLARRVVGLVGPLTANSGISYNSQTDKINPVMLYVGRPVVWNKD